MSAQKFVLELGNALHALGSPSYRVEDAMDACARALSLQGGFFATPTAIFASLAPAPGAEPQTVLMRVRPGQQDLGKLTLLYAVRDEVVQGRITAAEGLERLGHVLRSPPTWRPAVQVPNFALASATASVFLGGGPGEFAVAGAVGCCIGAANWVLAARPRMHLVFEPGACALAGLLVHAAAAWFDVQPAITLLASIIALLPGLAFTTALSELSMRHLAAGSARFLGAIAVLLTMVIGVGIGSRTGLLLFGPALAPPAIDPEWPDWALLPAVVVAAISFGVLLQASLRQLPWVLVAVLAGHAGSWLGSLWLERELGAFVGALAVAIAANLYARWQRQPAAVLRTPGLLLLVPGSLGFRGLTTALEQDFAGGVQFAFQTLLVGGALVAGLLVAGVLVPPPLDVEPESAI